MTLAAAAISARLETDTMHADCAPTWLAFIHIFVLLPKAAAAVMAAKLRCR